ncbi:MAG: polysaccharide biosynthesis C-terminal domain-containing protein [Ferruginibacter sp.]
MNILIARHFGAMVSGAIYYLINIYSLILLFTGFGIESGITFFTAKGQIDGGKLLGFSLIWAVVTGIMALMAFFFFIPGPYQLPGNVLLFSVFTFICGNLLFNYSTAFFYAKNNFIIPNSINVIMNIVLILLLPFHKFSVFDFVTDENYFYFYFGAFLLQGIILGLAVKLTYSKQGQVGFSFLPGFKVLLTYCLMAYASNLVFFFLYRIDYWFVKRYCTAVDLGNYIQVSKIGQLFFVLPTILASAVFPLTAGGKKDLVKELLTLISRSLLWLYMLACLFLIFTGNTLFPFLFGKSFANMYQAFLFLIPGILSLSMLFTLTAFYAGKNKMSININGALIALIFVVLGDYIFIPKYGINAAAFVSSIGYFVYLLFVLRIFVKEYNVSLTSFFIIRTSDFIYLYKKINNQPDPANVT